MTRIEIIDDGAERIVSGHDAGRRLIASEAQIMDWGVLVVERPEDGGQIEVYLVGNSRKDAATLLRTVAYALETEQA